MEINTLISAGALAYALFSKSELESDYKKAIQEMRDQHNAAINALSDDFNQQLNDLTGDSIDGVVCNMEVYLSGLAGEKWYSYFIINIHNNTSHDITFKGVRVAWYIDGRRSLWFPYIYGNEYVIKPKKCISLLLSHGNHKMFTKADRIAIRQIIEKTEAASDGTKQVKGTAIATFIRYVRGVQQDEIQYTQEFPVDIYYKKGNVITATGAMNKNGADMQVFDQ